jgi:long-chain-fatty-acid---luciferin-component ligase
MPGPSDSRMVRRLSTTITFRRLAPIAPIDELIFGQRDWLSMPRAEQDELRVRLIRAAFAHHLERCDKYAGYAERKGVRQEDIDDLTSLAAVPQFPTSVFKRGCVTSVPASEVVASFTSSGTSGLRSTVSRDAVSLHRLCGTIRSDSPLFFQALSGVDEHNTVIVNLGPSRQDAGEVWFSYVMALMEQLVPMESHPLTEADWSATVASRLVDLLTHKDRVFLTGPPFAIGDLCRVIEPRGRLNGGDRLWIITGGGWKAHEQRAVVPEEFRTSLVKVFGLESAEQVRDVFNQVELNTLLVECEHHSKHIPPWVHAFARHPATQAPLPPGHAGILSFSDASANSYPCFIVGEDFGVVDIDACPCGRGGPTLTVQRRIRRSARAGCAGTLAESAVAPPSPARTES